MSYVNAISQHDNVSVKSGNVRVSNKANNDVAVCAYCTRKPRLHTLTRYVAVDSSIIDVYVCSNSMHDTDIRAYSAMVNVSCNNINVDLKAKGYRATGIIASYLDAIAPNFILADGSMFVLADGSVLFTQD